MMHYLRSRLGEFISCVCICTGLAFSICAGFILDCPFTDIPVTGILVIAAVTAVIYLLASTRLSVIAGVCAAVAMAAAAIIYIQASDPFSDEETNGTFIFMLITLIVCIGVFLLTRTSAGTVICAILGNLIIAGSRFLDFPVYLWHYILFIAGCACMILMRNYIRSVLKAVIGRTCFLKVFIQSAVVALTALAAAFGLYTMLIRPLDLPVKDLQLISLLRNMDIMEVFGTAAEREVYDPELAGGQVVVDTDYGNDEGDEENNDEEDPSKQDEKDAFRKWLQGGIRQLRGVSYRLKGRNLSWLIAIPVLAAVLVFVMRLVIKRIWRQRIRALSPEDCAVNYYRFFTKRFSVAGYARPQGFTLLQYSDMMEHRLEPFDEGDSNFARLTDIYSRIYYGSGKVSQEELSLFESFYDRFHKNLRNEMGTFKYLINIFRI